MKVFIYTSSRRAESQTEKTMYLIAEHISEKYLRLKRDPIQTTIYKAGNHEILRCSGCLNCFVNGNCPLDEKDEMKLIKRDLLQSDIIMLGSPVYAGQINADMKCFIDRLSYWMHLIPLAGKRGIPLVAADNSSTNESSLYLKRIMQNWGLFIPASLSFTYKQVSESKISLEQLVNQTAKATIEDVLFNNEPFTHYHERLFQEIKTRYDNTEHIEERNSEARYWADKNIESLETISDYLNLLNNV